MRNNFFCIDVFIPEPLDSYYLYEKPFEHNISKFCFSESLAALAVQFDEHSYKKPFYPKNFLGSVGYAYFEIFYNYLEEHVETTFSMHKFLKYLKDPNLQKENYDEFKLLYYEFLEDYALYFEQEWYPAGLKFEIDFFKKSLTKEEVCILAIEKYALRVKEIKRSLKIFVILKSNGIYYVEYTPYGTELLKKLYSFIPKQNLETYYRKQFSAIYNENKSCVYKLRNVVRHINKTQWLFDEYCRENYFHNLFNISFDYTYTLEFAKAQSFLDETNPIYIELLKEKELLQELCYILYYSKAANGDIFLEKKLNESKNFLYNNNFKNCAFIEEGFISDIREGRTFKRYIQFLVKAGVIETEPNTYYYMCDIRDFCNILMAGPSLPEKRCLHSNEILKIIDNLTNFLKKIKKTDNILANKYLPTISKIREAKRYTKN